jgi:hypothetical protein
VINNATRGRHPRALSLATVLSLVLTCRSASAQVSIVTNDARTYAEGRRHEIEFTNAALAMLVCARTPDQRSVIVAGASSEHAEVAAAAGVGLRVADYRALVVRVDSTLRAARDLDARARRLDSLRVQLTVLRTRMNARQSQQLDSTHTTQPRSTACPPRS